MEGEVGITVPIFSRIEQPGQTSGSYNPFGDNIVKHRGGAAPDFISNV
jgi:hypothetical protein